MPSIIFKCTGQRNHMVFVEETALRKNGEMEKGYAGIAWESLSATIPTAQLSFDHRRPRKGLTDSSGRAVSVVPSCLTSGALFALPYGHIRKGSISLTRETTIMRDLRLGVVRYSNTPHPSGSDYLQSHMKSQRTS